MTFLVEESDFFDEILSNLIQSMMNLEIPNSLQASAKRRSLPPMADSVEESQIVVVIVVCGRATIVVVGVTIVIVIGSPLKLLGFTLKVISISTIVVVVVLTISVVGVTSIGPLVYQLNYPSLPR